MKTLVIYDSTFGNTEKLASAIASELDAKLLHAKNFTLESLQDVELLIIGSPTQAGRSTAFIQKVIDALTDNSNIKVAVFDTRMKMKWVKIFGFASDRAVKKLMGKKVSVVGSEKFFVQEKEGPLFEGEIDRAKKWAKQIS